MSARAFGFLFCLAASVATASAADFAGEPVEAVSDSLWLGHFSGGRNLSPGAEPIPLDWVDLHYRFTSLSDCKAWIKDMKAAYSTYEGFKTCLRLR
jgi:hypothetical protein